VRPQLRVVLRNPATEVIRRHSASLTATPVVHYRVSSSSPSGTVCRVEVVRAPLLPPKPLCAAGLLRAYAALGRLEPGV
jgi:hypothetical protein